MGDVTASGPRCPRCRAAVRAGAPWCTQCYAGLLPEPRPAQPAPDVLSQTGLAPTASSPRVAVQLPQPVRTARLVQTAGEASWPCAACGTGNALDATVCGCCGAGFLAGVRGSDGPLLELPGVGDVGALSRAQRLGLGLALMGLVVVLTVLLGLVTS